MRRPTLRFSVSPPSRLPSRRPVSSASSFRKRATVAPGPCPQCSGGSGYQSLASLSHRRSFSSSSTFGRPRISPPSWSAARTSPSSNPPSLTKTLAISTLRTQSTTSLLKKSTPKSTTAKSPTFSTSSTSSSAISSLENIRPVRRCDSHSKSYATPLPQLPFHFETGVGLFAKRTPRPFPPPFYSPPSGSFSDPLSTHDRSRDRRETIGGHMIGGCTNGDDAVYASDYFVAANDGVGAWSMRARGHAGLWSRLIVHFWADAVHDSVAAGSIANPEPVKYLQQAYEQTIEATRSPNDWQGTTTAAGAVLSYRPIEAPHANATDENEPVVYITNLGDSQVMVLRPSEGRMLFKTKEQWHWFDCPRQLGTNSPDTPRDNAVVDVVPIRVGDVVLAMSDGVIDNLWSHEIVETVSKSVAAWQAKDKTEADLYRGMMTTVAEELVEAARVIAVDPFAESPFMEHAIEEGLASEGGKLDDISVVAAVCRRSRPAQ
ncbi:protein phosphatase [Ophiostoma piceae UAMH 11346]|uniref:Protein phosphatase n=1 Tax=Ophiostoma piceae (strain UAMH 11346) TaxID=1262450 RepID=S3CQP5_OPHP1|nr:protein phosphatase [Ophiostoma piceae UAMH 11346]